MYNHIGQVYSKGLGVLFRKEKQNAQILIVGGTETGRLNRVGCEEEVRDGIWEGLAKIKGHLRVELKPTTMQ